MTIPRLMPDTFLWREEGNMQMRATAELGMETGKGGGGAYERPAGPGSGL